MAVEFRIEDAPVDDLTHVVTVHGEVDLFTVPEFRARISAPIDAGLPRVVVDLSDVTFIDSSSLGVLIGAHKRLAEGSGGLLVVASGRPLMNTFKITGLDQVFEILPSREAALATR